SLPTSDLPKRKAGPFSSAANTVPASAIIITMQVPVMVLPPLSTLSGLWWVGLQRQCHGAGSPFTRLAAQLDATAAGGGNAQAQARPSFGPAACTVHAIEPLENAREMFRGNANPGVLHGDDRVLALVPEVDLDRSAFRRVFDGVLQQIEENFSHPRPIAAN